MIAPHTLSNFQSLTKLIALIINHFYSHCRGDWQIALTKQNFLDNLFFLLYNNDIQHINKLQIRFYKINQILHKKNCSISVVLLHKINATIKKKL